MDRNDAEDFQRKDPKTQRRKAEDFFWDFGQSPFAELSSESPIKLSGVFAFAWHLNCYTTLRTTHHQQNLWTPSRDLLARLERQDTRFERRLDRLESNLARLDERTAPQ